MQTSINLKRDRLLTLLREMNYCVVAMSSGVDSAVVSKAAQLALADRALAVTASSESLAKGELEEAQRSATEIGIRHTVVETSELANSDYASNTPYRCFHCKTELYEKLREVAASHGDAVLVNGTNYDDLRDFRPGLDAAARFGVRSPLAECEISKEEVRRLAADWGLSVHDKPAMPCLSSRIAYGEEVTQKRLEMIDSAEQYLRSLGMRDVRVRYHSGDHARIEVSQERIAELCQPEIREALVTHLRGLGFRFVGLDLEGFCSGSLNRLVSLD